MHGRYALAAACVKQMSFRDAMKHKDVVLEVLLLSHWSYKFSLIISCGCKVACLAQSEQTSSGLAVIYDELIRQYWEEMSGKLRSFNLSAEVGAIQPLFLERARQLQRKFQGNNCLSCTFFCTSALFSYARGRACLEQQAKR